MVVVVEEPVVLEDTRAGASLPDCQDLLHQLNSQEAVLAI